MATFKVKKFENLASKGVDGDIAIIDQADVYGNHGFSFRNASGWSLPFVIPNNFGSNLMTTNTGQVVYANKQFRGGVDVVNSDFSVIGATDIDCGFSGIMGIGGPPGSQFVVDTLGRIAMQCNEGFEVVADDATIQATDGISNTSSIALLPTEVTITSDDTEIAGNLTLTGVEANSIIAGNFGVIEFDQVDTDNAIFSGHITNSSVHLGEKGVTIAAEDINEGTEAEIRVSPQGLLFTLNSLTENFSIAGLGVYADNAAALAGDLVVGNVYQTATGELRIVV